VLFISFEFVRHPDFARPGFILGNRRNYFWGEFLRGPGGAFYGRSHARDIYLIIQTATARCLFPRLPKMFLVIKSNEKWPRMTP
jgi:hypothetical protein